jgi:hypothetical protein
VKTPTANLVKALLSWSHPQSGSFSPISRDDSSHSEFKQDKASLRMAKDHEERVPAGDIKTMAIGSTSSMAPKFQ